MSKNRFSKLLTAAVLIGAPASALASPRTLASGAPACGNTMGKGGYRDGCTAEERAAWRAEVARERVVEAERQVARQEEASRAHERARRVAAKQREQLKQLATKADTVAEIARLTLDPLRRLRS